MKLFFMLSMIIGFQPSSISCQVSSKRNETAQHPKIKSRHVYDPFLQRAIPIDHSIDH